MNDHTPTATPHGRCPICRSPGDAKYRPFCSKRCADVDLARWLGGTYVVPGGGADADEDGDDDARAPMPERNREAPERNRETPDEDG